MTLDPMADSDFYRLSADDGPVWWLRGDPRSEPAWRPIGLGPSVRVPLSRRRAHALEERTFSWSALSPRSHVHRLFVWLMRVSTSLRYELAQQRRGILSSQNSHEKMISGEAAYRR